MHIRMSETPTALNLPPPPWTRTLLRRAELATLIAIYAVSIWAYLQPVDLSGRGVAFWLTWTAVMVRTFAYHAGLGVVLWGATALVRRRWRLTACMLPLAIGLAAPGLSTFLPRQPPAASANAPRCRVMSANLFAGSPMPQAMLREIAAADADLIFIQEYTHDWHALLAPILQERYPHSCHHLRDDPFGIALYSKHPFTSPPDTELHLGDVPLANIRAEVNIDGVPTVAYCIHLCPAKPGFLARAQLIQLDGLLRKIAAETRPVILAGDFNFTDDSPLGALMAAHGLLDAYSQGGYARGDTWPVLTDWQRWLPGVRIDHIYLRGGWLCIAAQTGEGRGSDHRPVTADLVFAR